MHTLYERLAALATVILVALAASQGEQSTGIAVAVTAVILAAAVRRAAVVIGSVELVVGSRARAHRESLSTMPAPRHPSTAGLPLSRAPSRVFAT